MRTVEELIELERNRNEGVVQPDELLSELANRLQLLKAERDSLAYDLLKLQKEYIELNRKYNALHGC